MFEEQHAAGMAAEFGSGASGPSAELGTDEGKPSAEVACRTEPVRQTEVA